MSSHDSSEAGGFLGEKNKFTLQFNGFWNISTARQQRKAQSLWVRQAPDSGQKTTRYCKYFGLGS
jgi:hypothetical protein